MTINSTNSIPLNRRFVPRQLKTPIPFSSSNAIKVEAVRSALPSPATHLVVSPKKPIFEKPSAQRFEIKTERIEPKSDFQSCLHVSVDSDESHSVARPRKRSHIRIVSETSTSDNNNKIVVSASLNGSPQNIKVSSTFKEVFEGQNAPSYRQHTTVVKLETSSDGNNDEVSVVQKHSVQKPVCSLISQHQVRINPNPVEPANHTYNIDRKIARLWAEKHSSPIAGVLNKVVDRIQAVSFDAFLEGLKNCTDTFIEKIGNAEYYALVQSGKSNQWVTELASAKGYLEKAPPKGFLPLGEARASCFTAFLEKAASEKAWDQIPERVVLFDDGSYSGNQLACHIYAIYNKIYEISKKYKRKVPMQVHIVVPYMTERAHQHVSETLSKFRCSETLFTTANRFQSLDDFLSEKELNFFTCTFWKCIYGKVKNPEKTVRSLSVNYFQHKIPNKMSFVPYDNKGSIVSSRVPDGTYRFIQPINPPYKG